MSTFLEQKSKDRKSEITAPTDVIQENFKFADELQFWHDVKGEDFPVGAKGFTKIAATYSSLHAIASNGKIYTWNWKSELPSNKPHSISEKLAKGSFKHQRRFRVKIGSIFELLLRDYKEINKQASR
jgi:alpha-tubulin suppressor-like RCC1 family protein